MYWSLQFLGCSFQKARNFTASSHQNAGFSIWVFKNFPGSYPRTLTAGGGTPSRTQHPARPLAGRGRGAQAAWCWDKNLGPLNFSAVWLRPWPGTIFRNHYHYFTQPTGFWCGAKSFPRAQSRPTYMNSAYDQLKIFEAVLGCEYQLYIQCQKYRHIRQLSFSFCGTMVWKSALLDSVACNWTGSNGSWKLTIAALAKTWTWSKRSACKRRRFFTVFTRCFWN